jgi:Tfp pilus assembly protein PilO
MKNKGAVLVLVAVVLVFAAAAVADRAYMPKYRERFLEIEKQRIITSNKLTTAKIVQENLNHVRELVFDNMDFPGQPDTVDHETVFYNFVTTCLNDLKLKLVSFRPERPTVNERVTTYGYDVEIEGDFFKFGELCAKFENSRRIMSIETFDVTQISDYDERGSASDNIRRQNEGKGIKVSMRINTYRIRKG